MKIGLYFGSFNPVHNGHLIIATHIINTTNLHQVWMVISPQNPLKASKGLLNEYDRFHLIQSALEGENNIRASNIEFNLPKPSFTSDTLSYIQTKYPNHEFSIIMGSDSYCNISRWKNHKYILENYIVYIYKRPGYEDNFLAHENKKILDAPLLEISSTEIRNLIKAGKSIRYMVPDAVLNEIIKNGYYKKS